MAWYFSPVIYILLLFWILILKHLPSFNTNDGGMILGLVAVIGGCFITSAFYFSDLFIRNRPWNKIIIIGLELTLAMALLFICFKLWKGLE